MNRSFIARRLRLRLCHIALLSLSLSTALVLGGCRQEGAESTASGPTVDVEPMVDIDPNDDPVAVQRGPELTGVMPGDFPDDLPLHLPASLIDFGQDGSGRWVDLLTPSSVAAVNTDLAGSLKVAGWAPAASGSFSKGARNVQLDVRSDGTGTVYRYVY